MIQNQDSHSESPTVALRIELTQRLLRSPVLWGLTVVRGLRAMTLVSLVTVLTLYLGNELEMNTGWRGFHIALLIVAGIAAKPVAGLLSDRFGRKQVMIPGLLWSCLATLALVPFDHGIALTVVIALLGLFLYPDQPILTATVFDVVGRDVASTGLGVITCVAFLMSCLFRPRNRSDLRNDGLLRNDVLHRRPLRTRSRHLRHPPTLPHHRPVRIMSESVRRSDFLRGNE